MDVTLFSLVDSYILEEPVVGIFVIEEVPWTWRHRVPPKQPTSRQ
jgi:hypothetical protein